jgi:hypothetical protein
MSGDCPSCGSAIVYSGKGRPRIYCECTPPQSGGAEWRGAWFAANRDRLEAERHERRVAWRAKWRASDRQRERTIAANRRRLQKKKVAP